MPARRSRPRSIAAVAVLSALAACGGDPMTIGPLPGDGGGSGGTTAPPSSRVGIELQSRPVAAYDSATGKTTVVVDFLVRDAEGRSVDPATATFRRLVNGREADVESVPDFRDTKLASTLRLGLVLDASYSMTVGTTPAFEPMKRAALDTQQQIRSQFSAWSAGSFTAIPSWFQDGYVCAPAGPLPDSAVLEIPAPGPGAATNIFSATAAMVDRLKALYDATPTPSLSDQFALVLFTDGFDNYSYFDATGIPARTVPVTGGAFSCAGPGPTALSDLLAKLRAFPQLQVHVIGLGSAIKADELRAIADAGRGRFVSNPDPAQVSSLFAEITREFTTVRRDGITMPLPPGDYEYVEEVALGGATARVRFRFHAGDAGATVRADTITTG